MFRKECHFPRSFVLLPLGVTLIFLLNAVRIAALILIGSAGAQQIALGGFHSQAGWISFCAVGVGFCFVTQRVPWFTTRQQNQESVAIASHNPTAAYLLPFLTILAAGMIATAVKGTGSLEWLYPLRFFVGLGMLWVFRRSYSSLNWKCDWLAPLIGVIVFVTWIGIDRFSNPTAADDVSAALMGYSAAARTTWITFRVLAAVVTVPLAEELAFRGFLMRRLISDDFESVSLRRFSWFALLASSLAFGLLHGGYWVGGSIAGILFGLVMIRRGRIEDAVVAHATANALLATHVLTYNKWHLW
jgi:exosortase E/protease (VPEID-CTERM system)